MPVRDLYGPVGVELGSAEIGSALSSLGSTSFADISGATVAFTAGTRPVLLEFTCDVQIGTSTNSVYVTLATGDGVTQYNTGGYFTAAGNLYGGSITRRKRLTGLTPGTAYTFKAQYKVTAGVVSIAAGALLTAVQV